MDEVPAALRLGAGRSVGCNLQAVLSCGTAQEMGHNHQQQQNHGSVRAAWKICVRLRVHSSRAPIRSKLLTQLQ